MLFIYELQKPIDIHCIDDYKFCYSLNEACDQYKFLYNLDIELIKEIQEIHFIYTDNLDETLYKNTFSTFSPILSDYSHRKNEHYNLYKFIFENNNIFPSISELADLRKRELITKLIRNVKFIKVLENAFSLIRSYSNSEIIIFLPFRKEITNQILDNAKEVKKILLFSDSKQMKIKEGIPAFEMESDLYFEIREKLSIVAEERVDDYENPGIYSFRTMSLYEIFPNTLLTALTNVYNKDLKRLKINGDQIYLAKRFIHHLLRSEVTPLYYSLQLEIPQLTCENSPLVFSDFDKLNNNTQYRELELLTKKINLLTYIILHSSQKRLIEYFKDFYEIDLPDRQNVENVISRILLTFLDENRVLVSEQYKLSSLIENNSFSRLLTNFENLDDLNKVTQMFHKISPSDLYSNTEMWYYIISKLKELKTKDKKKTPIIERSKIIFAVEGKFIKIFGLSRKDLIFNYSTSLGLKYIMILISIYNHYGYKYPVASSTLKILAYNLDHKPSQAFIDDRDIENDRKSILDCVNRTKNDVRIARFCEEHVDYSKYKYCFDPMGEIECEVIHSKIPKGFFDEIPELEKKYEKDIAERQKSKKNAGETMTPVHIPNKF
jgi:hypothetical protein